MNQVTHGFPNGFLHIREFATVTEAHLSASRLSKAAEGDPDFRLVELSPTASGAWLCAFSLNSRIEGCEATAVDEKLMNAFLSLGPKPNVSDVAVGIVESASIADVFKSAKLYSTLGLRLLEIRIKRAGGPGAYAFFALAESDLKREKAATSLSCVQNGAGTILTMAIVSLAGDYRRFF